MTKRKHQPSGKPPDIAADRPLMLVDADEVLLQFAGPLTVFLNDSGYEITFDSYRLNGNICNLASGQVATPMEVSGLVGQFFAERVHLCPPVEGAVAAMKALSARAQVVILSNVPDYARAARAKSLASHGLDYPLVANVGPKGPAVRALTENLDAPALFIDDLPHNHQSVAAEAAHVHRIHFVADLRLQKLIEPAEHAHHRVDSWPEAQDYIERWLTEAGY